MWPCTLRRWWPVSAAIINTALERIWEPIFIHDPYACRRGKGIHRAVVRLQQFIGKVSANGSTPAYYLQLDIKNYFMSIDKEILLSLITRKLKDEEALWLCRVLIRHDCTTNYIFKGNPAELGRIPPHKTLLQEWRNQIRAYLGNDLKLELNEKRRRLRPVADGVDFLGYIIRKDYLLVRRRVVNNLRATLREYEAKLVKDGRWFRRYRFDETVLDRLAATLSSYLGHFKLANSFNL